MKDFNADLLRLTANDTRIVRPRAMSEAPQARDFEGRIHFERGRIIEAIAQEPANVLKAHADPFDTAIEAEVA